MVLVIWQFGKKRSRQRRAAVVVSLKKGRFGEEWSVGEED
jgi:hypothetical protein